MNHQFTGQKDSLTNEQSNDAMWEMNIKAIMRHYFILIILTKFKSFYNIMG